MFRGVLGAIATAAAIVIVANYAPLLSRHADQDECTFGPLSNAQYRAFLIKARNQRPQWPAWSNDGRDIGKQLNLQVAELVPPDATLYERVAFIHAILRAIGAEYLNTNGRRESDPFDSAHRRGQDVELNYRVDINRLVFFQPYPRQLWIVAGLRDREIPRRDNALQSDRIGAALVSVFDYPPDEFLAPSLESCPPVPSAAEAARHQVKQN